MNAKKELFFVVNALKKGEGIKKIKCAKIIIDGARNNPIILKVNYTKQDFEIFISALDFEYKSIQDHNRFGPFLGGNVWFSNKKYLERKRVQGHEFWYFVEPLCIPDELY